MSSTLRVHVRNFFILTKKILPEPELNVLTALRFRGLSGGGAVGQDAIPPSLLSHRPFIQSPWTDSVPCSLPFGKLSTMSLYLRLVLQCPGNCTLYTKKTMAACIALASLLRRKRKRCTDGAFELDETIDVGKLA